MCADRISALLREIGCPSWAMADFRGAVRRVSLAKRRTYPEKILASGNVVRKEVSGMTQTWEESFAEENHRIRERMRTSSFEEIREVHRELEQKTLTAVSDEAGRLAVRRRAAEWLLYAATSECESL